MCYRDRRGQCFARTVTQRGGADHRWRKARRQRELGEEPGSTRSMSPDQFLNFPWFTAPQEWMNKDRLCSVCSWGPDLLGGGVCRVISGQWLSDICTLFLSSYLQNCRGHKEEKEIQFKSKYLQMYFCTGKQLQTTQFFPGQKRVCQKRLFPSSISVASCCIIYLDVLIDKDIV